MQFITASELKKINPTLRKRFGPRNVITSGTVFENEKGETQYHIVLDNDPNFFRSDAMLGKIGLKVKKILGADEVYYSGVPIA